MKRIALPDSNPPNQNDRQETLTLADAGIDYHDELCVAICI